MRNKFEIEGFVKGQVEVKPTFDGKDIMVMFTVDQPKWDQNGNPIQAIRLFLMAVGGEVAAMGRSLIPGEHVLVTGRFGMRKPKTEGGESYPNYYATKIYRIADKNTDREEIPFD